MNEALIEDYFVAESAIVARLQESVPELKAVYTPSDLQSMLESSQASPSAHVIYYGDRVAASTSTGEGDKVFQRWLVVVAVRSPKAQLQDTKELRRIAGPIVARVLRTVKGFVPFEGSRPLKRAAGAPGVGYSSSFGYFPYLFENLVLI